MTEADGEPRRAFGVGHELFRGPGLRRLLVAGALAVAGIGGITALGVAADLGTGIVRPLYAMVVLAAAVVGGLWGGVGTSLLAFGAYAYFFASPGQAVTVGAPQVFALVAFLAVALLVAWEEAARLSARAVQRQMAFLASVGRAMATSMERDDAMSEVTRMAVPSLADVCTVHLRRSGSGIVTREVAHADPDRERLVRELWDRYPPDPRSPDHPLFRVMETGRPELIRKVPRDLLVSLARDDDHLRLLEQLGIRSAVIVPLVARGRPLGAITMAFAESGRRYGRQDLLFLTELARTAALALDNARLYQERTRVAQTLQDSLLPDDLPLIPGLEVAVRYRSAGEGNLVGGDFYDVFETGQGGWAITLGDVCGKGPEAAALMGMVRHTIRTASVREPHPREVLSTVNRVLLRANADRFCTVTFGLLHRENGRTRLTVSCGGHPPPLVFRPHHTVEAAECLGTLLGVFPEPQLVDAPVELGPGDSAIFYTDGVTERYERAEAGGEARLVSLVWSSADLDAEGIAERIFRDAVEVTEDVPQDDVAVVVVRVLPDGEPAP
jgi:serine phosphatase RsbU (regulator of sigma subunit)